MLKRFLALIFFSALAVAQVTYSAPTPAQAAKPAVLIATGGTSPNVVTCSVTGNAVPATALTVSCSIGSVVISPYTIPFVVGTAYTFQHNFNGHALTVLCNGTASPIVVTATVDASAAVGGNF